MTLSNGEGRIGAHVAKRAVRHESCRFRHDAIRYGVRPGKRLLVAISGLNEECEWGFV